MQSIPKTFNNKQLSHVWEYRDSDDKPLGYVARFDGNGKKEIIPYFKRINGHDWQSGSATEPRPLFGLDKSAKADSDRAIFIVEGEKVAAALQSLGLVAITSQGGSKTANKTDWTPLSGRRCVYLLPDNDQPGEEYIQTVAAILANLKMPPDLFVVRLPNLPLAGDAVNWIKAWFENAHIDWDCFQPVTACGIDIKPLLAEFKKTVKSHVEPVPDEWKIISGKGNLSGWQAPISLESAKLPAWPSDVFPDSVQNFVIALSESTETPPEISAMMVLAVISAAAQGKYQVHVKADYSEPVNIWVCAALPPATRKTAVKTAATKPLVKWENSQRQEIEPEIKNAQADHATIQEKINQLRKKAANAKDLEFDKLKKEIADLESGLPEIPKVPQLWAQDITPENLGTVMADNKGRMAILSDEAGIFDIMGGRYSSGIPNLDLFLQGHAGSSTRVNRSSRPPVFMEAPALTMGLLPQPEVLRGLTEKPSFRGRGLLARMLYVMPSSNLGYRT